MPSFFLSVMPSKDLTPFSYISPQKNPFSTIRYELTIEFKWVKSQKTEKRAHLAIQVQLHSFLNWKLNAYTYVG